MLEVSPPSLELSLSHRIAAVLAVEHVSTLPPSMGRVDDVSIAWYTTLVHQAATQINEEIWPVFLEPGSDRRWRCNPSDPVMFFFEDNPEWIRFADEGGRMWWWHEASARVMFAA